MYDGFKDLGGGVVTFGTYPNTMAFDSIAGKKILSSSSDSNGYHWDGNGNLYEYVEDFKMWCKVEPIRWRVVEKRSDGSLLLFADKAIDGRVFNDDGHYMGDANRYADSDIRKWLNNDFYRKAFSESSRRKIQTVTVNNTDKLGLEFGIFYGQSSGSRRGLYDVQDKIFLLSVYEIREWRERFGRDFLLKTATHYAAFSRSSNLHYSRIKKCSDDDYRNPCPRKIGNDLCVTYWSRTPSIVAGYKYDYPDAYGEYNERRLQCIDDCGNLRDSFCTYTEFVVPSLVIKP